MNEPTADYPLQGEDGFLMVAVALGADMLVFRGDDPAMFRDFLWPALDPGTMITGTAPTLSIARLAAPVQLLNTVRITDITKGKGSRCHRHSTPITIYRQIPGLSEKGAMARRHGAAIPGFFPIQAAARGNDERH
ncbi:MAG: hypothetical protein ACE5ET_09105 [Gammaproteobacteria bacterium]